MRTLRTMLNKLPEDIFLEISTYLNLIDKLSMGNYFSNYYNPFVTKIQKWYRKYKIKRDVRYLTLYNQFQIRNKKMYTSNYVNIFFSLYNISRLRKKMKEYHFYCTMDYFYRNDISKNNIFDLYYYTLTYPTYTNLKKFLKEIKMELKLRL